MKNRKTNPILRLTAAFTALLCLISAVPVARAVVAPVPEADDSVMRVYGENRYETAFVAADRLKETLCVDRFPALVIASGGDFADALSGSYLAGRLNAPMLLADSRNLEQLQHYIRTNLEEDGTVYILGGPNAVPPALEAGLEEWSVRRLGGADRYETNLLILREAGIAPGAQLLVCTGTGFADSLTASALEKPILLVGTGLTKEQEAFLSSLEGSSFCLIGGTGAVGRELEERLGGFGDTLRISGENRYETSANVAKYFFPHATHAVLVSGGNFPDGLSGGALAAGRGCPLLLADTDAAEPAKAYVQETGIRTGTVLGGPVLISDETVREIFGTADPAAPEQASAVNRQMVEDYAARLYGENTMEDYLHGDFTWDSATRSSNWIYFTGLMFDSFLVMDPEAYNGEVREFFNQHIKENGTITNYIQGELDSAFLPAVMMRLYNSGILTPEEQTRYAAAANYVYHQLEKQTIYPEAGGLWLHSQKSDGTPRPAWTKWNICLDGVFMSQSFLIQLAEALDSGTLSVTATDGTEVTGEQLWNGIYDRLVFVMEHMRNPENGLLYHGYSVATGETNEASWSRGIGWYAMVLMEAAEKMPQQDKKEVLTRYFRQLMGALINWQDPATGLWYNVTDGREEYAYRKTVDGVETVIYNMPESSGSAMFAYCLLRGYHTGLLPEEESRLAGLRAFNALVETRLTEEGLTDIYSSSSVTGNKNLYQKNGYVTNDGKGVGPLIMAAVYAY